jgi:hypothetical protein
MLQIEITASNKNAKQFKGTVLEKVQVQVSRIKFKT